MAENWSFKKSWKTIAVLVPLALFVKVAAATVFAPQGMTLSLNCPSLAKKEVIIGVQLCEPNKAIDRDLRDKLYPGLPVGVDSSHDLYKAIELNKALPVPAEFAFSALTSDSSKSKAIAVIERKGWLSYGDLWLIVQGEV